MASFLFCVGVTVTDFFFHLKPQALISFFVISKNLQRIFTKVIEMKASFERTVEPGYYIVLFIYLHKSRLECEICNAATAPGVIYSAERSQTYYILYSITSLKMFESIMSGTLVHVS